MSDHPLGRCARCGRILWNMDSWEDEVRFHMVCLDVTHDEAVREVAGVAG